MSASEWDQVLLNVAREIKEHRHSSALDLLTAFLEEASSDTERREALAMRASVRNSLGETELARLDFERAHSLSRPAEYSRFAIEVSLARTQEDMGDIQAARQMLLAALKTAIGGKLSAGTAMEALLRVAQVSELNDEEEVLIRDAARASWQALRLEGPMPAALSECLRRILNAEGGE